MLISNNNQKIKFFILFVFFIVLPHLFSILLSEGTLYINKKTSDTDFRAFYNCLGEYTTKNYIKRYFTFYYREPILICLLIKKDKINKIKLALKKISKTRIEELGLTGDEKDMPLILWSYIYKRIALKSRGIITALSGVFARIKKDNSYSEIQITEACLSFVRAMKYKRPSGIFDLSSPLETLSLKGKGSLCMPSSSDTHGWNGEGDCDSKSLLLSLLLNRMGIKSVVLYSAKYRHALCGVGVNLGKGRYTKHKGIKYYFAETSDCKLSLGVLPLKFGHAESFKAIEVGGR